MSASAAEPLLNSFAVGTATVRWVEFSRVSEVRVAGLGGAMLILVLSPHGAIMTSIPQTVCLTRAGRISNEETLAVMSAVMGLYQRQHDSNSPRAATARIVCAQFRNRYVLQEQLSLVVHSMRAHSLDPVIYPYRIPASICRTVPGVVDIVSGRLEEGHPRLYLEGVEVI